MITAILIIKGEKVCPAICPCSALQVYLNINITDVIFNTVNFVIHYSSK